MTSLCYFRDIFPDFDCSKNNVSSAGKQKPRQFFKFSSYKEHRKKKPWKIIFVHGKRDFWISVFSIQSYQLNKVHIVQGYREGRQVHRGGVEVYLSFFRVCIVDESLGGDYRVQLQCKVESTLHSSRWSPCLVTDRLHISTLTPYFCYRGRRKPVPALFVK